MFGFLESTTWDENVSKFIMVDDKLICTTASPQFKSQYVGRFECLSVAELRQKEIELPGDVVRLSFKHIATPKGIGPMHTDESNNGAVFQAASQFNCLEMIDTGKSPTDGITIYIDDRTQGPVCALACPAALVYRNYLVEHVVDGIKYTGQHPVQIDNLKDVGTVVGNNTNNYWKMTNGYALPIQYNSLNGLAKRLKKDPLLVAAAENALRVGVHWETSVKPPSNNRVCQVYASALPCGYAPDTPPDDWEPFARLVLRASYKATLSVAASLTIGGTKRIKCYLTALGGGVFQNKPIWISEAITEALNMYRCYPIDVVLVHYGYKVHKDWITLPERETPVFVAYKRGNMFAVNPARDYQEIAYKIYMKLVRGEYLENYKQTINDMEITVFGAPPQVQFSIQKSSETFPYKFIIKKYHDDNKPSFVSLVKEDQTENILSNDEIVLRGWAHVVNRVTDM